MGAELPAKMWNCTFRGRVRRSECDVMGHWSAMHYLGAFDEAEWSMFSMLGFTSEHLLQKKIGWADIRHTIAYVDEMRAAEDYAIWTRVTSVGNSSVGLQHKIIAASSNRTSATLEGLTVQFDFATRKSRPLLTEIKRRAEALMAAPDTEEAPK